MLTTVPTATEVFDDAKRALAKLMAQENITVQIVAGASKASFDMVARVLTVPDWPGLTVSQIDLLIGHETGHSLWTGTDYIESIVESRHKKLHPGLMSYFNVVEDARIERKQREAFPGLKASFYDGYKDFTENGPIFKVSRGRVDGRVVSEMKLIDRINLFYKVGAFVKVSFSADEQPWIAEIDKAWSTERAFEIAQQLHELAKDDILKEQEAAKEAAKNQPPDSGESGEPGEESGGDDGDDKKPSDSKTQKELKSKESKDSGDGDSSDDSKDAKASGSDDKKDSKDAKDADKSDDVSDKDGKDSKSKDGKPKKTAAEKAAEKAAREALDPESDTDKALADALKKLAAQQKQKPVEQQIRHLLLKPVPDATVKSRTLTADAWSDMALRTINRDGSKASSLTALEQKWNDKYLSTAENMAQEFLRKKTAKNLMHARTGKSGRLDMNKLSKYKFADDLFKTITTVPNGQSHGIVMIVDGSSSMHRIFGSVLDQVLLFAHFTFKANITFECYMFTNAKDSNCRQESMGLQTITLPASGTLVGLVNTAQRASFRRQMQAVLALRNQYEYVNDNVTLNHIPYSDLGNTPLYVGMMLAERHVERMKRTLRLDKVTTVVISDGQDNNALVYETNDVDWSTGRIVKSFVGVNTTAIVVRDTVTKQNHVLVEAKTEYGARVQSYDAPQNAVMTLMFDVLKSRHGCRNIWIYLTVERGSGHTDYAPHAACRFLTRAGVTFGVHVNDVRKGVDETGQFVVPTEQSICDCAMVVKPVALELSENEFRSWDAKGASQTVVANRFVRATTKAAANRVFVNSVMPYLI
jgi:hypothetical protein